MRAYLRETKGSEIVIDIEGESTTERVLLSHLAEEHIAIPCVGKYGDEAFKVHGLGMRFVLRNEIKEPALRRHR